MLGGLGLELAADESLGADTANVAAPNPTLFKKSRRFILVPIANSYPLLLPAVFKGAARQAF